MLGLLGKFMKFSGDLLNIKHLQAYPRVIANVIRSYPILNQMHMSLLHAYKSSCVNLD